MYTEPSQGEKFEEVITQSKLRGCLASFMIKFTKYLKKAVYEINYLSAHYKKV